MRKKSSMCCDSQKKCIFERSLNNTLQPVVIRKKNVSLNAL